MKIVPIVLIMFFTFNVSAWSSELDLFFIQRNKNKNEVHYQLHVDEKCQIVSEEPITGHWKLLEESSDKTRSFSLFDRIAYGVTNQKVNDNWAFFNLRALERPIKVTSKYDSGINKCLPVVQTQINDKWSVLDRIYVYAKEGLMRPRVIYVDIFGKSLDSIPKQVTERVEH